MQIPLLKIFFKCGEDIILDLNIFIILKQVLSCYLRSFWLAHIKWHESVKILVVIQVCIPAAKTGKKTCLR